ncbi:MAG: N-acetyltransferase family protein [Clostridia bacterium]
MTFHHLTEEDLFGCLPIYNSNPAFMQMSEGSPVVTIDTVRKDYRETQELTGPYCMGFREKAGDGTLIGLAQFILDNPRDHNPWLGLLMILQEKQRRGYAVEFLAILHAWLKENEFANLHLAVLEQNQRVVSFYESCGYEAYEWRETPTLGKVLCMSIQL